MNYSEIEQSKANMLDKLTRLVETKGKITPELYRKYEVKRGLRDLDGKGVLVGLTEIGEVHSYIVDEGEMVPVPGRLIYRGMDIRAVSYTHLRAHETRHDLVCRLLLEKKK